MTHNPCKRIAVTMQTATPDNKARVTKRKCAVAGGPPATLRCMHMQQALTSPIGPIGPIALASYAAEVLGCVRAANCPTPATNCRSSNCPHQKLPAFKSLTALFCANVCYAA